MIPRAARESSHGTPARCGLYSTQRVVPKTGEASEQRRTRYRPRKREKKKITKETTAKLPPP